MKAETTFAPDNFDISALIIKMTCLRGEWPVLALANLKATVALRAAQGVSPDGDTSGNIFDTLEKDIRGIPQHDALEIMLSCLDGAMRSPSDKRSRACDHIEMWTILAEGIWDGNTMAITEGNRAKVSQLHDALTSVVKVTTKNMLNPLNDDRSEWFSLHRIAGEFLLKVTQALRGDVESADDLAKVKGPAPIPDTEPSAVWTVTEINIFKAAAANKGAQDLGPDEDNGGPRIELTASNFSGLSPNACVELALACIEAASMIPSAGKNYDLLERTQDWIELAQKIFTDGFDGGEGSDHGSVTAIDHKLEELLEQVGVKAADCTQGLEQGEAWWEFYMELAQLRDRVKLTTAGGI